MRGRWRAKVSPIPAHLPRLPAPGPEILLLLLQPQALSQCVLQGVGHQEMLFIKADQWAWGVGFSGKSACRGSMRM